MSKGLLIAGLAAMLTACTGRGMDMTGAVPVRAHLEVRPVADGHPWVDGVAADAQGTLAGAEVIVDTLSSRSLPPVHSQQVHAGTKGSLVGLVERAGPVPAGLRVAYERKQDDRWVLVAVREGEGMTLGSGTLVKAAWGSEPGEHQSAEGVFLLLERGDAVRFEQLTVEHDGRRLAILDGDEALMAPVVQEPVGGGQILITPGPQGTVEELYERLAGQPPPPRPSAP